jgi:hypothetical protein
MPKTSTGTKQRSKTSGQRRAADAQKGRRRTKQEVKLGSAERILEWIRRNPLPTGSRRSAEEIDAGIAAERDAWD